MLIKHADRHLVVGLIKQCSILHDVHAKSYLKMLIMNLNLVVISLKPFVPSFILKIEGGYVWKIVNNELK